MGAYWASATSRSRNAADALEPSLRGVDGPHFARTQVRPSRQVPFAAEPQMFLGFELRHPEQEAEHVELVASRQPGQLGNGLRNDGRGLVRASLACWFIA